MCISVDLPEPEGPMTAANWPRGKSTSTPRRASTAASPVAVRARERGARSPPLPSSLAGLLRRSSSVSVPRPPGRGTPRHPRRSHA